MAFSFGAPTPTAAPTGGLFGVPAPAPSATAPPPSGGLFGAAPAASAPALAAGGLFGTSSTTTAPAPAGGLFGSTPAPSTTTDAAPTPAAGGLFGAAPVSTTAPAPSGGLFGAPATSTPAPSAGGLFGAAPAPAAAPKPSEGLFGASAPAAPTPAPTAEGLFGSTTPAGAPTNATAPANQPIANIPAYHTAFPRIQTRNTVLDHVAHVSGSGRELIHILSTNEECGKLLSDPKGILKNTQENAALRNALVKCCNEAIAGAASNTAGFGSGGGGMFGSSSVGASGNQQTQSQPVCVTLNERAASITPSIAKDVLCLSNELHISEVDALSLFAEANALVVNNEQRKELEDDFVDILMSNGKMGMEDKIKREQKPTKQHMMRNGKDSTIINTARHLFFHERAALLYTILDLIRYRIQAAEETNSSPIIVATDQLLQSGLVLNLIASVRELNDMSRELRRGLKNAIAEKERRRSMGTATATPAGTSFGLGGFSASAATAPTPQELNLDMEYALLGFTQMQRQLASECLFYLAYHTQMTAEEVASMIDLIKDLTNGNASVNDEGLPLLDPLIKDVPNPYEEDLMTSYNWQQQQHYGAWNKPLPLKSKDARAWKDDLIANLWARGQPQLLQCVSTLIMSVTCALDARHTLINRQNHGPNPFGKGNSLLPPMSGDTMPSSLGDLQAVHSRLDPESQEIEKQWQRRDIWGLLLIPYALLIRDAAGPQFRSPAKGSGGSRSPPTRSPPVRGQWNMKATCTKCLMVASQLKSLTFARMSMIPSFGTSSLSKLEMYGVDSSIADFYVSVFAEFTSQFIDALCATGNLPITRKDWYDEEYNLAQTEWAEKEQRRQFGVWAGTNVDEDFSGPREVNIMDRPDCLEDIFALVSTLCSTHPESSKAFWKIMELEEVDEEGKSIETVILAPSRFLERLDLIHADSDSLLFVFISFLASLSLANGTREDDEASNGASTIHSFLCGERTINTHSDRHVPFGWTNIIGALRWYAEMLSPDDGDKKSTAADGLRRTSSNVDASETTTSYYYGASGDGTSKTSSSPQQGRPSTPDDPKRKELDEVGTNTLMALLCLISHVVARSSVAREYILSIQLQPDNNGDSSNESYQQGSLEILFSLLTTPISTDIQGMTFMTIANLLQPTTSTLLNSEDSSNPQYGKRAWELLEMIQLIPIKLLENSSLNPGTVTVSSFASLGRNQISNSNDLPMSVFPPSADYGLLYQLEHVESEAGTYPSTNGFMYLLTTLIRTAGFPPELGSQWRMRSGCLPYIEIVTDFILPRATGSMKNVKPLPFATVADQYLLISRALEVVEAVLVRYVVPDSIDNFTFDQCKSQYQSFLSVAKKDIGVSLVPEILRDAESLTADEMTNAVQDFKNVFVNQDSAALASVQTQLNDVSNTIQIPRPKTPGFAVMANLLSFNKSRLFGDIHNILYQHGGSNGIRECGEIMLSRAVATGLFRETPPNIGSSKLGVDLRSQQQRNQLTNDSYETSISAAKQSMIDHINPVMSLPCTETSHKDGISHGNSPTDAIVWRERTILLSLRILAAVAVREEAFIRLTQNANLSVVPTLSFKGPIHGSFAHRLLEEERVYVTKLANILTKVASHQQPDILPLITDGVGYIASSLKDCHDIAKSSFCIVSYVTQTFSQSQSVRLLCGDDVEGTRLTRAFSRGFALPMNEGCIQNALLDLILTNIGLDLTSESSFSYTILGVGGSSNEFLNVILEFISNVDNVMDPATSSTASKCYEVIFRLMQLGAQNTPPVLLSPQFWHNQVKQYLGMQGPTNPSILHEISSSFVSNSGDNPNILKRNNDVLHSISWLLKGLSLELFVLAGEGKSHYKIGHAGAAQSLTALLVMLFSQRESLLQTALLDLPLGQSNNEHLQHSLNTLSHKQDALKGSTAPLPGPNDVCARFEVVDMQKLSAYFDRNNQDDAKESTVGWATAWNFYVSRVCACSHISHAWSDLCRTATIISNRTESNGSRKPFANTRVITEILCTILVRLNAPEHLDQIVHFGVPQLHHSILSGASIESESAIPLSTAALCLTDFLYQDLLHAGTSEYVISDEDLSRICALLDGAILSSNDDCVKILKAALCQMEALCEGV